MGFFVKKTRVFVNDTCVRR